MQALELKAWISLVLLSLGVTLPAHEFLGGLFIGMGCCYGVMAVTELPNRKTLWTTLVVGFLGTLLAAIVYPHISYVNWLPVQAVMGAAGALSRYLAEAVIELGQGLKIWAKKLPEIWNLFRRPK